MAQVLIWDLPTRLFHWLFAGGFAASALISLGLGEDSPLFPYHSVIGLVIGFLVLLRLAWGLAGTRYARFDSFLFSPAALAGYLKGVLTGGTKRYAGHNPGSAYAVLAMLGLFAGLAATGTMLGHGYEGVKEVHEILAYSMLAVVGAHVLGVIVHTVRHGENITAGMVHGRKQAEETDGIRSSRPLVAGVALVATGAWTTGLLANYNPATQTTSIPLFGTSLQLGEAEGRERDHAGTREGRGGHDEDD